MSEQQFQVAAPLQTEAFRQLRRKGADKADLSTFEHGGHKYKMRVDRPCRLDVHLITIEHPSDEANGHKQSMVAVSWDKHEAHDVRGLELMMHAFAMGVVVDASGDPHFRSWRIVPWVQVPAAYLDHADDAEVPHV